MQNSADKENKRGEEPQFEEDIVKQGAEEGISPNNGVLQQFAPGLPCILGQTGIAFTHCFIGEAGFSPVLSVLTYFYSNSE